MEFSAVANHADQTPAPASAEEALNALRAHAVLPDEDVDVVRKGREAKFRKELARHERERWARVLITTAFVAWLFGAGGMETLTQVIAPELVVPRIVIIFGIVLGAICSLAIFGADLLKIRPSIDAQVAISMAEFDKREGLEPLSVSEVATVVDFASAYTEVAAVVQGWRGHTLRRRDMQVVERVEFALEGQQRERQLQERWSQLGTSQATA